MQIRHRDGNSDDTFRKNANTMNCLKLATFAAAIIGISTFGNASDGDELREQAESLRHKAEQHLKQGHAKEARELNSKADLILQKATQLERESSTKKKDLPESHVHRLESLLEKLRDKEHAMIEAGQEESRTMHMLREAIEKTQRDLSEVRRNRVQQPQQRIEIELIEHQRPEAKRDVDFIHRPEIIRHREVIELADVVHRGDQLHRPEDSHYHDEGHLHVEERHVGPPHIREIAERLEHMHIAAEHLRKAGLHDIAERVAERAEATEVELHRNQEMHNHDQHRPEMHMEEMTRQIQELRHQIERLHERINNSKNQR